MMLWLPLLGLLLAAAGYLAFALLLVVSRLPTTASRLLLLAVVVSMVWLAAAGWRLYQPGLTDALALLGLEAFKDAAWLVFLSMLAGGLRPWLRGALVAGFGALHFVPEVLYLLTGLIGTSATLVGHLLLKVVLLLQLEQLFRRTRSDQRWTIKPLILGLGLIFIFELVLYAESLLVSDLNASLVALTGYVYLLALPCLLLATRRTTQWSVRIFVSRQVVFHSTMTLAVGGYLLLMALAGYYLSSLGAIWGGFLQQLFYLFALFLLAALLLAGQFRRRLKVFISKHFFANKYEYRQEWLALNQALAQAEGEDVFERMLALMLEKSGFSQGYLIWRGDQPGFSLRARRAPESPLVVGLVAAAEPFWQRQAWIVDLVGYRQASEPYEGLFLPLEYPPQWQLLVPLIHRERVCGAFVLLEQQDPHVLDWEERDFLNTVCQQLALFMAFAEASSALAVAKQFEAFNQMSAFLVHDVKNTLAQLNLITRNAEKHRHNPAFIDDTFETIGNVSQRLERMLGQLRQKQALPVRTVKVPLEPLLARVCQRRQVARPRPRCRADGQHSLLIDAEKLENVLCHLVQNAQEATPADGWIRLAAYRQQQHLVIEVADNGQGMDEAFIREKLFTPFHTTKGNAGMGIGAYEAKRFVEESGGELQVESRPGEGTRFYLRFAGQTAVQ